MSTSADTSRIVKVLEELGRDCHFLTKREQRYRPTQGQHSQRTDVAFLLPDGRPALYFEVDSRHDRAAFNRLKVFGDPLSLAQLPLSVVSVQFGKAADRNELAESIIRQGLILPPTFVVSLRVDSRDEQLYSQIKQHLEPFLTGSAIPQGGALTDVGCIMRDYQELQCFGALDVAAAHLDALVTLARLQATYDPSAIERAVAVSCARARLLQQAGRYAEANTELERTLKGVKESRDEVLLSDELTDEISTVRFKLWHTNYGSKHSQGLLRQATSSLHLPDNRAKFVWRTSIDSAIRKDLKLAASTLAHYSEMRGHHPNGQANAALVSAISALLLRGRNWRDRAIGQASQYAQLQKNMWVRHQSVETGSINGVLTGLLLEAIALNSCDVSSPDLDAAIHDIEQLRVHAHVSWLADGLRDIASLKEGTKWPAFTDAPLSGPVELSSALSRSTRENLEELCVRMDDLVHAAHR